MICGKDTIDDEYLMGGSEKHMQVHLDKYRERYF